MRLTAIAGIFFVTAAAVAQQIHIAVPVEVARESEPKRFSEPHLAVHPSDPKRLLASAFILPAAGTTEEQHHGEHCATFSSTDGGITWNRHEFPFADCGDPQVAILPDGHAVFVALAELPGIVPKSSSWMFAFHSADGGVTWDSGPTIVGRPHDHPAVTVDFSSPNRKGWMYVTANQSARDGNGKYFNQLFVARSRNGGQSFDAPLTIHPNSLQTFSEMPVVLMDGTVLASFTDDVDSEPTLAYRRAWVIRSNDGSATLSPPMFVTDECGPPHFQLAALAVDRSEGPFRDRLYFACRRAGGGPIVIAASGDHGSTWSRPSVAVGTRPDEPLVRRVVTLAVNTKGVLGVFVVERRPDTNDCLSASFYGSFDGGKSFVGPAAVSASSCGNAVVDQIAGRVTPTYGDYFGLVSLPDGRFRAMWPEMRDGHSVLLTTIIDVDANRAAEPR